MNYDNPELMQHLAAEYALGTLRGPARRRFEHLMAAQPTLREHVAFWECRLSDFGAKVAPVTPPLTAKSALMNSVARALPLAAIAAPEARQAPPRRSSWRRRLLPGAAAAASLMAAFLIGKQTGDSDMSQPSPAEMPSPTTRVQPIASSVETDSGHERYLAQLKLPASKVEWLVSVSSDQRRLSIVAAEDYVTQGQHRLQLWWISDDHSIIALATLPATRGETVTLEIPAALQGRGDGIFVVSMEPGNGSTTFVSPRGPVLTRTAHLNMI